MSSVYYTTEQSSSHDDHVYQNTQQWSLRQQLNIEQDTSTESFTDLLMSSPLDNSPEPICPETSSFSSLSHAQQYPVARRLIMSPDDFTFTEQPTNSFQQQYSSTTTDRKRKSSVLEDESTGALSDHSSNSESSGVFSDISNNDHNVTSFNMSCIQPDNKNTTSRIRWMSRCDT